MKDLATYPFHIGRHRIGLVLLPLIPILFLLIVSMISTGIFSLDNAMDITDHYFGGTLYLSAKDPAAYDMLGADGVPPVMRIGGITKDIKVSDWDIFFMDIASGNISRHGLTLISIWFTIFLAYIIYAVISRALLAVERKEGILSMLKGINMSSIALSLIMSLIIMIITGFALKGFQLVLMLNFCIFFLIAIPRAAIGESVGESLHKAINFMKDNLGKVVQIYLLSMGVAIAAPIGLLLVFMFPISVLHESIVPTVKFIIILIGISFALFYQAVIAARVSLDFSKKNVVDVPAFRKIAKRMKE